MTSLSSLLKFSIALLLEAERVEGDLHRGTSDNSNMKEQINKQTKTKSKLPQCHLFANRLEKPCYSKISTSDFGPETTSQGVK